MKNNNSINNQDLDKVTGGAQACLPGTSPDLCPSPAIDAMIRQNNGVQDRNGLNMKPF